MVTPNEGDNGLPQHIHPAPFDEKSQPAPTLHLEHRVDHLGRNRAGVGWETLVNL